MHLIQLFSVLGSQEIVNGVYMVDSEVSYKEKLAFAMIQKSNKD